MTADVQAQPGQGGTPAPHPSGPIAVLAAATTRATPAEARALARTIYGIEAEATPLTSERDQNFLLEAGDGARYVLKLNNPAQAPGVSRFQIRALLHVAAADPEMDVPHVIATLGGAWEFGWSAPDGTGTNGRLVTYLAGTPLAAREMTLPQAEAFGRCAARLGRALRGFFDPEAGHPLLWDLKQAAHLAELLPLIDCDQDRRRIAAAVETFGRSVAPRLPGLRAQVIHCDLNPHNVLVEPSRPERICGIIDFGDLVHSALVNDVAIAAAYLWSRGDDPLETTCRFLAGYHAVTPLEREEIALLFDLIGTRQALTCAIAAWRAKRNPDNAAYITRNRETASRGTEALAALGRDAFEHRVLAACRMD